MNCAIEVQRAMVERNAGVAPDKRIEFRIGIHLGDVVEESDMLRDRPVAAEDAVVDVIIRDRARWRAILAAETMMTSEFGREACRGLRTEFPPFSRVLRLKSPASLSHSRTRLGDESNDPDRGFVRESSRLTVGLAAVAAVAAVAHRSVRAGLRSGPPLGKVAKLAAFRLQSRRPPESSLHLG